VAVVAEQVMVQAKVVAELVDIKLQQGLLSLLALQLL
jgi:hypothetical protein